MFETPRHKALETSVQTPSIKDSRRKQSCRSIGITTSRCALVHVSTTKAIKATKTMSAENERSKQPSHTSVPNRIEPTQYINEKPTSKKQNHIKSNEPQHTTTEAKCQHPRLPGKYQHRRPSPSSHDRKRSLPKPCQRPDTHLPPNLPASS